MPLGVRYFIASSNVPRAKNPRHRIANLMLTPAA
jgi:hypothetical protein